MEHRWCKRWRLVLDVQLEGQGAVACHASTRNISLDGMFIEAAPDSLTVARLVHVQLPAVVGVPCLKAIVIHSCERGVGLMFCALGNEERRLLAGYLSEGR
jgi:hypothetical protein